MSRWVVCLVAQGGDDCSTLKFAARLAEESGARLAIIAVIDEPGDGADLRDALRTGSYAVADLARRCGVVDDAVHCVEVGEPLDRLMRVAERLDAEVIVVGDPLEVAPGAQVGLATNRPVVVAA